MSEGKIKRNTGLGKGLGALFGDLDLLKEEGLNPSEDRLLETVQELSVDLIKPNKDQPRKKFDDESLQELEASIAKHGILQPILVRPSGKGYEIVVGERRYRAARAAGIKNVPCIVRKLTDKENMLFAIIENMQRQDLNPLEEAKGIESMMKSFKLTQEQVSDAIGKSRSYIANATRLLKLPGEIKSMVMDGVISRGHAITLLGVKDEEIQLRLAEQIVDENLSVRALEDIINGKERKKRAMPRKIRKHPDIVGIEEELKNILGTKVNLKSSGKKGKIEIEYFSREELDRLIEMIRGI